MRCARDVTRPIDRVFFKLLIVRQYKPFSHIKKSPKVSKILLGIADRAESILGPVLLQKTDGSHPPTATVNYPSFSLILADRPERSRR